MGEILCFLYMKPLCFWHSHPGMSKWPPMVDGCVLSDTNWFKLGVFWPYLVRTREMMGVGYSILTWLSLDSLIDISRLSPSPLVNLVMFSIPPWLIFPARLHPKHRLGLLALSHSWTPVTWRKPWEIPWEKMWKNGYQSHPSNLQGPNSIIWNGEPSTHPFINSQKTKPNLFRSFLRLRSIVSLFIMQGIMSSPPARTSSDTAVGMLYHFGRCWESLRGSLYMDLWI